VQLNHRTMKKMPNKSPKKNCNQHENSPRAFQDRVSDPTRLSSRQKGNLLVVNNLVSVMEVDFFVDE